MTRGKTYRNEHQAWHDAACGGSSCLQRTPLANHFNCALLLVMVHRRASNFIQHAVTTSDVPYTA
jgi:hypothetical protein